jgi:hypothetical protein
MADLSAKDGSQETMVNLLGQSHRAPTHSFLYVRKAVLRIRIRIRIHVFFGLLDPDPDQLVKCMDPDPDPSIIKQK